MTKGNCLKCRKGREFFTGGERQSQKRPQVNRPSPPTPLPKGGEGRKVAAAPRFENLTQRIKFLN